MEERKPNDEEHRRDDNGDTSEVQTRAERTKYEAEQHLRQQNLPLAAQVCLPLTKAMYCVSALMKTVDVSCEAREVGQSLYAFGLAGLPEHGAPDTGSYWKKKSKVRLYRVIQGRKMTLEFEGEDSRTLERENGMCDGGGISKWAR